MMVQRGALGKERSLYAVLNARNLLMSPCTYDYVPTSFIHYIASMCEALNMVAFVVMVHSRT